ncbi:XdhC family protein [Pontibacter sp. E15-1]|uniref:XdhC family protein n=1 Tax=Pontibacter sp. E15-1 TaxID=2919918 RepID=UPI001F5030A7|nr:XdhC/CoxI family protein [Pontibacter sp. E15-1]MCJ8165043.1 XdhC family protein [Pontibacter sp. E15-1]
MKEIQDIVSAFDVAQQEGKQTALATVVHVQGSSYRRPGARMLVTEDGQLTGAISGGCLEGDALRKARLVMAQQRAMLVTYDTTDEDDAKLGVGLGCNGVIQILIEPIDSDAPSHPIQLLKSYLQRRQSAVLVTLFSLEHKKTTQVGTCFLMDEQGQVMGRTAPDSGLQTTLVSEARQVLQSGMSRIAMYTGAQQLTGFLEALLPAVSLVVVGAGNDAIPLVQMATVLGWQCTVVDGRANYATAARFPEAAQVLVSKPEQVLTQVSIDKRTAFVLMTHNYNYDLAMLRQLLPLQLPYVGTLGPKKKLDRMLEELKEEGMNVTNAQQEPIHGPTGLDIGAETAEEIALSILAEIKAVFTGKEGGPLRDRKDVIHSRVQDNISAVNGMGQVSV